MGIQRFSFALSAAALLASAAWAQTPPAAGQHELATTPAGTPSPPTSGRQPSSKDAYVYIGWPKDGEVVGSKFKVWFGTRDFGVAPAGVAKPKTGHHHLLIDTPLPPLDQPIPNDSKHLHFGLGQTETVLELPPGKHTLQLLMGDADHIPHDPALMSKVITITVRVGR
jgi:hypothetical protein